MALAAALLLPALPVQARYGQSGFSNQCFKEVYREEYIPGTQSSPGRVRRWTETKEVPCQEPSRIDTHIEPSPPRRPAPVDDNSCIEGALLGGLAGGAAGGTLATQENWIWSIPAGIISGSLVGCQVDGG